MNTTKVVASLAIGAAQANGILAGVATLLATYKAARAAWTAAHPGADSPFKTDAELIDMLAADADGLVAHADAVLAKHQAGE